MDPQFVSIPGGDAWLGEFERELSAIRSEMFAVEEQFFSKWSDSPEHRRASARNLLHYLALRRRDLRVLQSHLAAVGLSSLGRAESQVLPTIEAVLKIVQRLASKDGTTNMTPVNLPLSSSNGRTLLESNTRALLGEAPARRDVRIMVTLPSEAADDYTIVRDLLASGMDCARINAAHDDQDAWERMVRHIERARAEVGRPCRILVDLAGPKLRTGPIQPGPPVLRWRPRRDAYGRVASPARLWLTATEHPSVAPEPADATLTVPADWIRILQAGDVIKLFDARDSMRALKVVASRSGGIWAESEQTAYVVPGTMLYLIRGTSAASAAPPVFYGTQIGPLPSVPEVLQLAQGDTLVLTRSQMPGVAAVVDHRGKALEPARMSVTLPEIFDDVQPGESIWFDDGKIGGVIRTVSDERIEVTITHTKPGGARLGADKGINLPDSQLRLPPLTPKDIADLTFIARRADLVGYSFVRSEGDVHALQARLAALGRDMGIVLKIETRRAFEQLPELLLAAMRSPSSGVMIARGDLAIECGYERLAEVQEEILWLAEASHTPVIWATQVLETLTKNGIPSRAEITDAAMGERAECVMLNKGPYVVEAVRALDNILVRMQAHQRKKSAMLRHLELADRFLSESPEFVADAAAHVACAEGAAP